MGCTLDFNTMATFFALAALVANVATVALIGIGVAGRGRDQSPFEVLRGLTMWLAGFVALAATLASLYLSEIAHLIPCRYCWFQRIAMYPLVIILLVGAYRKDSMARLSVVILATIGIVIAAYHRFIQAFPDLDAGSCASSGPACSAALIEKFGFVTIPYMSFSAFALILTLLWADRINDRALSHTTAS
jgi:disulfide bond formation protein DsbB